MAIKVVWWPSDVEHKPEEAFIVRRKPNLSAVWGWGLGFLIFISSYPTHKNPRKAKTSKVSSFALTLFSLIMYSICIAFWVRALLLCFDFVLVFWVTRIYKGMRVIRQALDHQLKFQFLCYFTFYVFQIHSSAKKAAFTWWVMQLCYQYCSAKLFWLVY